MDPSRYGFLAELGRKTFRKSATKNWLRGVRAFVPLDVSCQQLKIEEPIRKSSFFGLRDKLLIKSLSNAIDSL